MDWFFNFPDMSRSDLENLKNLSILPLLTFHEHTVKL